MNEVFETVAEVLEELRSEAEEREYSVHTNESENADKALKKANREYETVLAELSAEHREFFENYMDIVDHAHFQEEQRAYIIKLSTRKLYDESGQVHYCIDETLRRRLETKLITKILAFEVA